MPANRGGFGAAPTSMNTLAIPQAQVNPATTATPFGSPFHPATLTTAPPGHAHLATINNSMNAMNPLAQFNHLPNINTINPHHPIASPGSIHPAHLSQVSQIPNVSQVTHPPSIATTHMGGHPSQTGHIPHGISNGNGAQGHHGSYPGYPQSVAGDGIGGGYKGVRGSNQYRHGSQRDAPYHTYGHLGNLNGRSYRSHSSHYGRRGGYRGGRGGRGYRGRRGGRSGRGHGGHHNGGGGGYGGRGRGPKKASDFYPKDPTFPKICPNCNVEVNSEQQWTMHVTGKKHIRLARSAGFAGM